MLPLKFKYSYDWGQSIVQAFVEKQSRGTENVCRIAGMSQEKYVRFLISLVRQENQVAWRAQKIIIKQARMDDWHQYEHIAVEDRRKYLTIVKYNAEDLALDDINREKALDYPKQQKLDL